jgi:FixJ family two-component response regulator
MKPIILYVDDEKKNLSMFELMIDSDEYELLLFSNAVEALSTLKAKDPWVIISDQRMPGMTGLEFLEIANQLIPETPRIVITGQTDEETIIKLVRKAQLFDYICKPASEDEILSSILRAVSHKKSLRDLADARAKLESANRALESRAKELEIQNKELESLRKKEATAREEAEAWSSIEIVEAVSKGEVSFPMTRSIVCVAFDIIGSKRLHGKTVESMDLRQYIVGLFMASLLNFDGILEGHGGDGAYGHFGCFSNQREAPSLALAACQEFRQKLRNMSRVHGHIVECGIAIHYAADAKIDAHRVSVQRGDRQLVKKSIYSSSPEVDYVFSVEELAHYLPGTNIFLTSELLAQLDIPSGCLEIGSIELNKMWGLRSLSMIKSDMVSESDLQKFLNYMRERCLSAGAKAS